MKKKINQNEKGMTLVEVVVSLLFITLGLVPIFGIFSSSFNLAARIQNNLIAANLAQEGIEVVRAIRDASWMKDEVFDQNLPNGDYLVSWDSHALIPYNPSTFLKRNNNSVYSHTAGNDTFFKRRINISRIGTCDCELKIISEVTWLEKRINRTIAIESHLFNWR